MPCPVYAKRLCPGTRLILAHPGVAPPSRRGSIWQALEAWPGKKPLGMELWQAPSHCVVSVLLGTDKWTEKEFLCRDFYVTYFFKKTVAHLNQWDVDSHSTHASVQLTIMRGQLELP